MKLDRISRNNLARRIMLFLTIFFSLLVFIMAIGLYLRSRPILAIKTIPELFSTDWHPLKGNFGFFPFIMGTVWVTGTAMVIAVPLCLLTAIYLAEYAHHRIRELTKPLIDLLAGIPSVVYGIWGVLAVVPLITVLLMDVGASAFPEYILKEHLNPLSLFGSVLVVIGSIMTALGKKTALKVVRE